MPATIQLVVTATGQTTLTAVNTGAAWTRVTDIGKPFGSTRRCRLRSTIAGGRAGGRIRRPSGGTAGGGAVQEDHRLGRRLSEHAVFFRLTLLHGDRAQPKLLSNRFDQQSEIERDRRTREPMRRMTTINVLKELEVPGTPLFLFDCTLPTGDVQHWSTHNVTVNGQQYLSRVLKHNIFDLNSSPEAATDGVSTVSITLANADSFLSSIERNIGWKGSSLVVTFLFFDLTNQVVASNGQVVFRGIANPPDQSTESTLRLSFTNTLNLQRVFLPAVRIQKLCPWNFPSTAAQRQEAVSGGTQGAFSPFYQCGYSAGSVGRCREHECGRTLHNLRLFARAMPTEGNVQH